jgi:ABC-2 type transport system ATP-binding protein
MSPIISANGLSFGYRPQSRVVKGIDLNIYPGEIYGFLGPNGAGKTTTIRLLLGLLSPDQGSVQVFGQAVSRNNAPLFSRIGAMIETPSLYEHLTALENLEINRKIRRLPHASVRHVLQTVDLAAAASVKVREFSLGMKQRLGLAIALLAGPELLILDEPTNGLDPHGIIQTRELLESLNRQLGTTILVSSHILAEVEKLATHVGIIDQGEFVFQGTMQALQDLRLENSVVELETNNNALAATLLSGHHQVLTESAGTLRVRYTSKAQCAQICRLLCEQGLDVYRLNAGSNDLENIFFQMVKR